jgi:hypothetical protein
MTLNKRTFNRIEYHAFFCLLPNRECYSAECLGTQIAIHAKIYKCFALFGSKLGCFEAKISLNFGMLIAGAPRLEIGVIY